MNKKLTTVIAGYKKDDEVLDNEAVNYAEKNESTTTGSMEIKMREIPV